MSLNELSAKMMKAEMLGDEDRAAELRGQIEQLRKEGTNDPKVSSFHRPPHRQHHNKRPANSAQFSSQVSRLNALNAKIIKAELMGDIDLVSELKAELNQLQDGTESLKQRSDIELPPDLEVEAFAKERREQESKLIKLAKKVNEDRLSLTQMFVKSKLGDVEDETKLFLASSSKLMGDNEYDDVRHKKKRKYHEKDHYEVVKDDDTDIECDYCLSKTKRLLIVAIQQGVYLCLPPSEPFVVGLCFIRSQSHIASTTQADETCLKEILQLQKKLCLMFDEQNLTCIFIETYFKRSHRKHFQIECLPIKKRLLPDARMYFKKAILECEGEWSMNKKLIDAKDKPITSSIPKGLSYFWVTFGSTNDSFGHVIEEEKYFPKHFGYEVIAGLLDIDRFKYTKPRMESFDEQSTRVSNFKINWKKHNLTDDTSLTKSTDLC